MPKSSRAVARRYAAASQKRRKAGRHPAPPIATTGSRPAEAGERPAPAVTPPAATAMPAPRPRPAARRPSIEYAEHYRHVWADIKRIALIAGSLLAGLVALSFVLR